MAAEDKKLRIEKKNRERVGLYACAADHIFKLCFTKAELKLDESGVLEKRGWGKLRDNIKNTIGIYPEPAKQNEFDWQDYHNDLRDLYWHTNQAIGKDGEYAERRYDTLKFLPLLLYAKIADREGINKLYAPKDGIRPGETGGNNNTVQNSPPVVLPVVYTAKHVKAYFNLLDDGHLWFYYNRVEFKSVEIKLILPCGSLEEAREFAMDEDEGPVWTKIKYKQNGLLVDAYFAEYQIREDKLILLHPINLTDCFEKLLAAKNSPAAATPER